MNVKRNDLERGLACDVPWESFRVVQNSIRDFAQFKLRNCSSGYLELKNQL